MVTHLDKKFFLFFINSILLSSYFLYAVDTISIDLITTNDIHGVIGEQTANFMNPQYPPQILGGTAMFGYVEKLRESLEQSNRELLLLDGGNFFQGHPFGLLDGGESMIEWMNGLEYDAIVPGRYDFILGSNNLNRLMESSNFPFLAANLTCKNCELISKNIQPFLIKEINGVKIGILGIVTSGLKDWVLSKNINGITVENEIPSLKKWIPKVKEAGAEIVIVLASTGVPWEREKVYSDFRKRLVDFPDWNPEDTTLNTIQMGYYSEGVDIIISGGESKGYPLPFYDPKSHTFIFQNYGNGTEFGHIQLLIDSSTHKFIGYKTVIDGRASQTTLADDFTPHLETQDIIQNLNKEALDKLYTTDINWEIEHTNNTNNCEKPNLKYPRNNWEIPSVNTIDNIEIVTWNCEFFPTAWEETIEALAEAVTDFDADLYAFQEIRYTGWFSKLMDKLPEYDFIISNQSSFMDQAIVFKKDLFYLIRQVEPFADNDYNFAGRPPLRGDFWYICGSDSLMLSVLNVHSKCCDSGLWRRKQAVKMLHEYVVREVEMDYTNFIILGDWNDDLRDAPNQHSFHPFLSDDRFFFVNQDIIHDPKQVSYPKEPWVSFLDHILVSTDLVPPESDYYVQTLPITDYMKGYNIYEELISDHLPVMLRFSIQNTLR